MTRTFLAVAAFIAATASFAILQKAAAQDVEKGQRSFFKCLPCHAVGPGAENKVGPELNGLDGRHAGTAANFNYSDANKNSGIVWNEPTFKAACCLLFNHPAINPSSPAHGSMGCRSRSPTAMLVRCHWLMLAYAMLRP